MNWWVLGYVVGWVAYLFVIPRMGYQNPRLFLGEWKLRPSVHPGKAAAEFLAIASPLWFLVLIVLAWHFAELCIQLSNFDALKRLGAWIMGIIVPEYDEEQKVK